MLEQLVKAREQGLQGDREGAGAHGDGNASCSTGLEVRQHHA